jgi:N-sulfoglucosamine sulfohydrolase
MPILTSKKSGLIDPDRQWVVTGRERHTHARPDNVGYPCRAIRAGNFLYILNLKPQRWPAGDPDGYEDIDGSPTKSLMIENKTRSDIKKDFELGFDKRPERELYDLAADRECMHNLASNPKYAKLTDKLNASLIEILTAQGDPRVLGNGDIFDSYPRFMKMRDELPGFKEQGKYNPDFMHEGQL